MMVSVKESGMVFGPYPKNSIFEIEHSDEYIALGDGLKAVEFIYRPKKNSLFFVEAKSSSPRPETLDFDEYIKDISEKFVNSFNYWMSVRAGRRKGDFSNALLKDEIADQRYVFVLVINGHEISWLPPVMEGLKRKLRAEIKIWNQDVVVYNDTLALEKGLISERERR